jgi:hypothetical protein
MKHSDISQTELSRRIQGRGLQTVDKSAVNKILKGERKLSAEEMLAISAITGFQIPGGPPPTQTVKEASHTRQIAREDILRKLMAEVFKTPRPQGMSPVSADNLSSAILLMSRRPPGDDPDEAQIKEQARALTKLFAPEAQQ